MANAPANVPAPLPTADEVAANNAKIAAQVAAQDIFGQSNAGNPNGDTGPSLDELMKKAEEDAKKATGNEPPVAPKAGDEPPAPAPKAGDEPPAPKAGDEPPPAPVEDPLKKKADEIFKDSPTLPPNASPKSAEAFSSIKLQAAKDISERDSKIDALAKELAALKESAGKPSPEQAEKEKELKELRDWRTKLDVDFDPAFKSFDQKIASGREFIYAQLRKSPAVTEDIIDLIKKFGGPENTNMAKLWERVNDPTLKSIVESQIAELAKTDFEKKKAIEETKKNLDQYLANRQTAFQNLGTAHLTGTQKELDSMLDSLDWWKPQTAKAEADEVAKKAVADHNAFLEEAKSQMTEALRDDSPKMRAILIAGTLQLFNLQRIHAGVKAELDTAKKALADVTAKWEKVKKSSRSLEGSAAPSTGALPAPKQNIFTTDTGSSLDAIAKQVMEEQNAKLGSRG